MKLKKPAAGEQLTIQDIDFTDSFAVPQGARFVQDGPSLVLDYGNSEIVLEDFLLLSGMPVSNHPRIELSDTVAVSGNAVLNMVDDLDLGALATAAGLTGEGGDASGAAFSHSSYGDLEDLNHKYPDFELGSLAQLEVGVDEFVGRILDEEEEEGFGIEDILPPNDDPVQEQNPPETPDSDPDDPVREPPKGGPNGNNGHGNNHDGVDNDNPGQGSGGPNGQKDPNAPDEDEGAKGNQDDWDPGAYPSQDPYDPTGGFVPDAS